MYLGVNAEVIFPQNKTGRKEFKFATVSSFKVESTWQALTDTAEVVVAKKLFFDQKGKVFELIKKGDPIKIRGGYNGEFFDEFTGFVSEILDDMPVMLKCEDNMYLLKRTRVHNSYSSIKLEALLKAIVPSQFKINAMDIDLGSVVMSRTTVSQVLQTLKDDFGIYSYFVGDTLVSGKIYTDNPNNEIVKYSMNGFNRNIITNDLAYRSKDDINIKVTMTSHLSDGTKKSITVGDEGGQEQKLICSNIYDTGALRALAEKELARLKIDGYSGGMTTFAIPFVRHGYTSSIINNEYPERGGDYYVDGVTTTLNDMGAYHRVVKIGPRATKQPDPVLIPPPKGRR